MPTLLNNNSSTSCTTGHYKKQYAYKDPVIPTDKELENWKPLSGLIDSDLIIKKLENKKRKDIVTDLTWKNVCLCRKELSVDDVIKYALALEYEYLCYQNKVYQIEYRNGVPNQIDTGLTGDEVNEIL